MIGILKLKAHEKHALERVAETRRRVESSHRVKHAQQPKRIETSQDPMQPDEGAAQDVTQPLHKLLKASRGQTHRSARKERRESDAHTKNTRAQVRQALSRVDLSPRLRSLRLSVARARNRSRSIRRRVQLCSMGPI